MSRAASAGEWSPGDVVSVDDLINMIRSDSDFRERLRLHPAQVLQGVELTADELRELDEELRNQPVRAAPPVNAPQPGATPLERGE